MTATPRIVTGANCPAISMDDEKVYGPVVYRLSFAQAIELGLLADYRLVAAVVTQAELELLAGGTVMTVGGRPVPARMLAAQIALGRAIGEYDLRRVISYHNRIAAATRFAISLPEALELLPPSQRGSRPLAAWSVNGRSSSEHRRSVLQQLRQPGDATVVVANARLYNEGINLPALDAVEYADKRQSVVDVVQGVGRALRRGGHREKIATVLVPVLTTEQALAAGDLDEDWSTVLNVVRALRAHDERVEEQIERAQQLPRSGAGGPRGRYHLPWLETIGHKVPAGFADRVRLHVVKSLRWTSWHAGYQAAADFYAQHGHLLPPDSDDYRVPGGERLGRWLREQRSRYRKGAMAPDRVAQLDQIGMVWDPLEVAWREHLAELTAWRAEHGDVDPPYRTPLSWWLRKQCLAHRRGKLEPQREAVLRALGVNLTNRFAAAWERGLHHAREHARAHGNLRVPQQWRTPDGYALGRWLHQQRFNRKQGKLLQDQIAALEELGLEWADRVDEAWRKGLAAVKAFHAEHGHLRFTRSYVTADGFKLGSWMSNQRAAYRAGRVPAERVAALEALGIDWAPRAPTRTSPPDATQAAPPPAVPPAAPTVLFLHPPADSSNSESGREPEWSTGDAGGDVPLNRTISDRPIFIEPR
jgi:hypothetical protein